MNFSGLTFTGTALDEVQGLCPWAAEAKTTRIMAIFEVDKSPLCWLKSWMARLINLKPEG